MKEKNNLGKVRLEAIALRSTFKFKVILSSFLLIYLLTLMTWFHKVDSLQLSDQNLLIISLSIILLVFLGFLGIFLVQIGSQKYENQYVKFMGFYFRQPNALLRFLGKKIDIIENPKLYMHSTSKIVFLPYVKILNLETKKISEKYTYEYCDAEFHGDKIQILHIKKKNKSLTMSDYIDKNLTIEGDLDNGLFEIYRIWKIH